MYLSMKIFQIIQNVNNYLLYIFIIVMIKQFKNRVLNDFFDIYFNRICNSSN